MAHTLGEAVAPRRNSVSANDVADSLLSSIKKRIRERLAAHWYHGFQSNLKSQREARGAFAETISWRSWSQSGHSHRDGKHDQVSIIIRTNCAQNVKEKWIMQNVYIAKGWYFQRFCPRWGAANLDERPGKVYLAFAILLQVRFVVKCNIKKCKLQDLEAHYSWRKNTIK